MIHTQDADFTLLCCDVVEGLRSLPDESVHCVVTSPPYWGLRDYGTGDWEGGDPGCDHAKVNDPALAVASSTLGGGKKTTGHLQEGFKEVCGKCGARRVDQQLGLEPTPDLYVARIVEVFREVKRVLRADGTCWLNLGDSYGSGTTADRNPTSTEGSDVPASWSNRSQPQRNGLKPKDLVGIPWRVAFALQQPYYTGRIKDERDRIWLAAMVEAEGCMFIHKRKAGQSNGQGYERKNATYGAGLEISSTDRAIVERCMEIAGIGSICEQSPDQNARRKQTIYRWNARTNACRDVIRELYPHFIAKQHEARLLLGCPSSGPDAEKAHASLKAIHQGQMPDIDFAAPASLFEAGWYLRSDCIWSKKPNPMPESVTDRPTKAHEYVFLLSKSPRYFFDQEAVREPAPFNTNRHMASGRLIQTNNHDAPKALVGSGDPPLSRNVRSVWEIATQPYPEAHFATYPEELVRRCVLAGTSERGCCPVCGKPWERRIIAEAPDGRRAEMRNGKAYDDNGDPLMGDNMFDHGVRGSWNSGGEVLHRETVGWRPGCDCVWETYTDREGREHPELPWPPIPCTVLDPFLGSGTTAYVARKHGRRSIGIELNPEYCELAARRMQQQSLFALEAT